MTMREIVVYLSELIDKLEGKRVSAYDRGDYETACLCMGRIADLKLVIKVLEDMGDD